MLNLLTNLHNKAEELRGHRLIFFLLGTFLIFSLVGFVIGGIINRNSIKNSNYDLSNLTLNIDNEIGTPEKVSFEGKITFVDPNLYPNDDISYTLVDSSGKEIVLLKAIDQKLVVSEGHFATVYGDISKTKDGKKDVLIVDKIVINQRR